MKRFWVSGVAGSVLGAGLVVAPASGQSDPAGFGTVYNIGTVPPGSIFDAPGAVTGTSVGDGDFNAGKPRVFLTPTNLGGNALDVNSQLNIFAGGEVRGVFDVGTRGDVGSNIEVNILGGLVRDSVAIVTDAVVNVFGGTFVAAPVGTVGNAVFNIYGGDFGSGPRFWFGSVANISGGTFDEGPSVQNGSVLNVSGGTFGGFTEVFNATANVSGGVHGNRFEALALSTTNISGGTFGDRFRAVADVNISEGTFGAEFGAGGGSMINIAGGTFGRPFLAQDNSAVNLFGTSFFLNGVAIPGLVPGQPRIVTERGNTLRLTGTLVDGSAIDFILNSAQIGLPPLGPRDVDLFKLSATLTVTLVPGRADFNLDGAIDASDLVDFAAALEEGNALAHVDDAPAIDFFDMIEFLRIYDEATD